MLVPGLLLVALLFGTCSADCDVQEYFQALDPNNPQMWALQMLDSSSKTPTDGLLEGTFVVQLGNYDQCLAARGPPDSTGKPRFTGQYCLYHFGFKGNSLDFLNNTIKQYDDMHQALQHARGVGYTRPVQLPISWAVCAPSTCGTESVKKIADSNLQLIAEFFGDTADTRILVESCYYEGHESKALDAGSWSFLSFFAVLVAWICFSTGYDHFQPNKQDTGWIIWVNAFSLKNTWRDVVYMPKTVAPGQLSCLHGIRAISMLWVMLGHIYLLHNYMPMVNYLSGNYNNMQHWYNAPILNGPLSVDTFLLLSGLLTVYVPMMDFKKGRKFNIFKYYVYRYLRITAPHAVMVWYLATVNGKLGHGPLWFYNAGWQQGNCQENWWASLLYITNYVKNNCLAQAWYLCVDMQLALLAPILIMPMMRWPRYTLAATVLLMLGSMAACFGVTYVHNFGWTVSYRPDVSQDYAKVFYPNTPLRAVPYLVGMLMGYILSEKIRVPLSKGAVVLGWLVSAASCLSVLYTIMIYYDLDYRNNKLDASFYAAFHKFGWSLGVSWVIWACVNGYGGFVNSILSWKFFLPMSKLTFAAFLVHQDWMLVHVSLRRAANYLTNFEVFYKYFGHLFFVLPLSILLYLAVEAPLMNLLRAAFKKRPGASETKNLQELKSK